ncbi:hypothetical protein R8O55_002109 [Klebsiella michiganensis]|nr:hypothetical protein [Klebsiella michiganensis]HBR1654961.1 hypothetical protein [Klebsiella pneumoniae]
MLQPVILPLVDLPPDSPHIPGILNELSCKSVVSIPRTPQGPAGICYWNVESMVKSHGGKLIIGWLIQWVPGLYVQAMHHGVWESPDGKMWDLTADQTEAAVGDIKNGTSTFVPDNSISIDLQWPVMIVNKHHVITNDPDVIESLYFYRLNCQASASLFQYLKIKGGYKWQPISGMSGPEPNEEINIFLMNNNSLKDLSFELMHKHRDNIRKKYFANEPS